MMSVRSIVARGRTGGVAEATSPAARVVDEGQPTLAGLLRTVVLVVSFLAGSGRLSDNSLFTHVETGRLLVRGKLGSLWNGWSDPYLATSKGASWVVQSWLASLTYGAVDRLAGGAGLRLFFGLTFMVIGIIVWRLAASSTLLVRFATCVVVLLVGSVVWSQRPLLFGVIGAGLVLLALRDDLDPRWLVPVMWVWVNTHGSFPFALVIVVAAYLGRRLDGEAPDRELRVLRYVAAGTALGALVNPIGPKLVLFPLALLGRMSMLRHVAEWRSPDFSQMWSRAYLLLVVAAIAALVRRPRWHHAVPAMILIAASLLATRNVSLALVVLTPVIAQGFDGLGSDDLDRSGALYRAVGMVLSASLVIAAVAVTRGPAFDERTYPADALSWLEARGLLDAPVRLVHQDPVGNYIELRYDGAVKTYIDDRIEVADRQTFDEYLALLRGWPSWKDGLRDADVIIWQRELPLESLIALSPEWAIRWQDNSYFVACRSDDLRCR